MARDFTGPLLRAILAVLLLSPGPLAQSVGDTVAAMARVGRAWAPSFSPDGRHVAFLSDRSGVPQVWIVAREGGEPRRLTDFEDPVGAVEWSPRGDWIALSVAPGGGSNRQLYLVRPDGTKLRRLTEGEDDRNSLGTWEAGGRLLSFASNRRDPEALDSFVFDVETGEARLVAENRGIGRIMDMTPDGRRAVLFRLKRRGDNDLYLLDLETGREELLTPHTGPGRFGGGRIAPQGSCVYLSSDKDRDLRALGRVRLDGDGQPGPIEVLASRDDAELESFVVTEDGRNAALLWNHAGRSELAFLDLDSLTATPAPPLPAELCTWATFSPDGRHLAFAATGSAAPSDIWVLDTRAGEYIQITHSPHAGVDLDQLVRPRLVRYPAHDGLELTAWLYRPRDASGPGPIVVSFHGGPEGQERPSFEATYQALLSRGIGVLAPNVRGSSGFGKAFVHLDDGALRKDAIEDIRSSVRYAIESEAADPERIGIMGGSYGGFMTMSGLTWFPELFAAGVNLYGVVNFATFFDRTESWIAESSRVEYGDPETEMELLRDLSPIHRIDRVRAPTLVLHGANDTNVPVLEAEQVVARLEERGVPVELVLFPDEGHGFRKEANRVRAATAIVRWFETHLKEPGQEDPARNRGDTE